MEDTILCFADLSEISDAAMKDISARVAGLKVHSVLEDETGTLSKKEIYSLVISTQGDYSISIVLSTDAKILYTITSNMKRGRALEEGDIPIYAGEFFNILCGHIVSTINIKQHIKARFGIPVLKRRTEQAKSGSTSHRHFYRCQEGIMELEIIF